MVSMKQELQLVLELLANLLTIDIEVTSISVNFEKNTYKLACSFRNGLLPDNLSN